MVPQVATKTKPKPKKKTASKDQLAFSFAVLAEEEFPGYTTQDVIGIVGITTRQLDHWTRDEIVSASIEKAKGSGSTRHYSYRDLLEIRTVKQLREMGLSLETIKDNFAFIRSMGKDVYSSILVLNDGQPTVVTEEKELLTLASRTMKTGKGQGILNLNILNMSRLKDEVTKEIEDLGMPIV